MREVEVKIAIDDADAARARLGRGGAVAKTPRYFEDNRVYDDERGSLASTQRLLRVRTIGSRHILTFKRPDAGGSEGGRYKVRIEHETKIEDPGQLDAVLEGLGFRVVYRYQKYRQRYDVGGHTVLLDETPIGVFLEIEGSPDAIDEVAETLGVAKERYITKTYFALHQERSGRKDPGDLVFPSDPAR